MVGKIACMCWKMLKSVIQSIPTYPMSTFILTKKVCKSLTSPMAKYFWSSSLDKKAMHWVSWKELSKPKCEGGLGFRDLHIFNMGMLARQGWRLIQESDSLCGRVLRAKYFPDGNLMNASLKKGSSLQMATPRNERSPAIAV